MISSVDLEIIISYHPSNRYIIMCMAYMFLCGYNQRTKKQHTGPAYIFVLLNVISIISYTTWNELLIFMHGTLFHFHNLLEVIAFRLDGLTDIQTSFS